MKQQRRNLVDVESDVQEVDFALLPAVFLQQLHQHRALLRSLLLFLCPLFLLFARRVTAGVVVDVILAVAIVVLVLVILVVLLREAQLELRVLPERLLSSTVKTKGGHCEVIRFDLIQEQLECTTDGDKRTSVSAAAAGGAPWCPAALVLTDGPSRSRDGRSGRGRNVPFHKCVWVHATQLHNVEQFGEVVCTDPNR